MGARVWRQPLDDHSESILGGGQEPAAMGTPGVYQDRHNDSNQETVTPLLAGDDLYLPVDGGQGWFNRKQFVPESKRLFDLTLPSVGMYAVQALLATVSLAFVGHLGAVELASAAISVTVTNACGRFVLLGLSSGMETLCGQAFGAGQLLQLGEILQLGIIILNLSCVPLIAILWHTEAILLLCHQQVDVAHNATVFVKYMIPGIIVQAWSCTVEKFLQAQGLVVPLAVASSAAFLVHVPFSWFLVFKAGLGLIGAAIAISVSYAIYLFGLLLWIWHFRLHEKTWHRWSLQCFQRWGEYMRLSLPACVMLCIEWWSFELAIIVAGLLPNPAIEVGAFSICLNAIIIIFMLPLGLSVAVSTRVSNELGAGHPRRARQVAATCIILALSAGGILGGFIFVLRNQWSLLFTDTHGEEDVRILAARMFPFVAVLHFSDFVQVSLQGVLRGSGRQLTGALVNLGAFYVVAVPIGLYCAFSCHLGALGIWIGLMCGSVVQSTSFLLFAVFLDWNEESRKAVILVKDGMPQRPITDDQSSTI
ncbi:hypothetical protein CBR_g55352 [Chara braunii]|uniref:Protein DETOXIFICATION n=1 Tax=Chara braunii TaxID=69332 RepID=A0A388MCX9_CHABU|nr:hypothetical protein CBR_g55352 [Chara braunii]|eukprot:GBG92417.1 hypothetical protein CBR_g55352 [Chara braunii]